MVRLEMFSLNQGKLPLSDAWLIILEELWNFADDGGLDDNTKEVVLKIIDLMKNDKWEEANKMWQDEDMSSLDDESNGMASHNRTRRCQ